MKRSAMNDLVLDLTGKATYSLGVGTVDERPIKLPPQLGKLFDEQFKMMAQIQMASQQDPSLRPLVPIIQSVFVLWAYTAQDNAALREQIALLEDSLSRLLPDEDDDPSGPRFVLTESLGGSAQRADEPDPEEGGDPPPA